jgi:hypothetical protein
MQVMATIIPPAPLEARHAASDAQQVAKDAQRAESLAQQRAERLAEQLRAQGIEPEA